MAQIPAAPRVIQPGHEAHRHPLTRIELPMQDGAFIDVEVCHETGTATLVTVDEDQDTTGVTLDPLSLTELVQALMQ